ncbi:DUF4303 domain-containing protein [Paenibacillus sp. JJ-223]|uniref:DUF4303 domain-containing protein n=1 Tax=Paenibacillus sp. JJ-223 TaxID=2905647 RepID=UPI001F2CFB0C|nr:DUF4303 domain-containing protein [Paenibacillus sp. JJ-223]CAH1205890.1 hypothetical protein PAECIP111890_02763 [Paenibacillus sp. JJ-223]
MTVFLKQFEERFRASFVEDLKRTLEQTRNERVYACAFGTDSDFVTLFLAVNTEESLARHIADMKKKGLCNSKEDEIYFRWGCSEYQYGDDTHFNDISKLLYAVENAYDYKDQLIEIIARVVQETEPSVFAEYGQSKEDIVFFVSMTDDDQAEELENESVALMTRPELIEGFLKRYEQ